MKTAVVAGARGCIRSHLVKLLKEKSYFVKEVDLSTLNYWVHKLMIS